MHLLTTRLQIAHTRITFTYSVGGRVYFCSSVVYVNEKGWDYTQRADCAHWARCIDLNCIRAPPFLVINGAKIALCYDFLISLARIRHCTPVIWCGEKAGID